MIDKNTKFDILFRKSEALETKRQRLFLIVILLPILYFLIESSIIDEINLTFFSIKQINIILLFYPSLYALLCFYIYIITNHNSKVIDELNFIATDESDSYKQYQKEKWLKIIQPINLLGSLLGSIRAGGLIGCIGVLFVSIPIILFTLIYPVVSLIYFLYNNFKLINSDFKYFAIGNIIFTIWICLALLIYSKSIK